MNTTRFTYYDKNGGYKCSQPGDHDGEYVRLADHNAEVERLQADIAQLQALQLTTNDTCALASATLDIQTAEIKRLRAIIANQKAELAESHAIIGALPKYDTELLEILKELKRNREQPTEQYLQIQERVYTNWLDVYRRYELNEVEYAIAKLKAMKKNGPDTEFRLVSIAVTVVTIEEQS